MDRKEYARKYYQEHRDEIRAQQLEYQRSHREDQKAYYRAHRSRILERVHKWHREHPGYARKYSNRYYECHKTERRTYRESHKSMHAINDRKNLETHRNAVHRRRTIEKAGDLTVREWNELLEECGFMCVKCGAPYEHLDHIVPLSKGGKHTLSNVQPLCARCNLEKGSKEL